MNRLRDAWFEFKGVSSFSMGVSMIEMPKRALPYIRGKHTTVSGRDGSVYVSDGTYETVDVTLTFDVRDGFNVWAVDAWLRGSGRLVFSDEYDYAYDARISKAISRKSISKRFDGQRYSVTFTCQPFKYGHPEAAPFTVSASPTTIRNPGTAPARPLVKITGQGAFSVTIGAQTMMFTGVTGGGIIVDSELMDALTYDGADLANDRASGQPWEIMPGPSEVSWAYDTTDSGNGVTSVEILPRWRWV